MALVVQDRRVALLIESSNSYGRGLLAGIHEHRAATQRWVTFLPEHGRGTPPWDALLAWRGDGVVARIENERIARFLRKAGVPVVDTSAARLLPNVPYVETDDAAIARLAGDHLREIGLRHFAYCGDRRFRWSENRRDAFVADMKRHGHEVDVLEVTGRGARRRGDMDPLGRWLAALPKPVGVFACYDALGRQLIDACHVGGITVPDEVAVLGVDDDELLCQFTTPPLSSVIPDARGAGRLAAESLDRILDGGRVPTERLLGPRGVAVRQSTDFLAMDDPLVADAVRFLRRHVGRGVKVNDVADAVHVSRRMLEQRFVRAIGRTPHEELVRAQFRLVEDLLRSTDLKIAAIAQRCGFRHPEYLSAVFTRRYGVSPTEWRSMQRR